MKIIRYLCSGDSLSYPYGSTWDNDKARSDFTVENGILIAPKIINTTGYKFVVFTNQDPLLINS